MYLLGYHAIILVITCPANGANSITIFSFFFFFGFRILSHFSRGGFDSKSIYRKSRTKKSDSIIILSYIIQQSLWMPFRFFTDFIAPPAIGCACGCVNVCPNLQKKRRKKNHIYSYVRVCWHRNRPWKENCRFCIASHCMIQFVATMWSEITSRLGVVLVSVPVKIYTINKLCINIIKKGCLTKWGGIKWLNGDGSSAEYEMQ